MKQFTRYSRVAPVRTGMVLSVITLFSILLFSRCQRSGTSGAATGYISPVVAIVEPGDSLHGRTHKKVTLVYVLTGGNDTVSLDALLSDSAVTLECKMHQRGDATFGSANGQYAVKLHDTPPNNHFMGMPHGGKDWIFHEAGVYDESLLRNVMAFHAQREMGQWAPRTRYFEMFVIESASGTGDSAFYAGQLREVIQNPQKYYRGIHINMEKIMAHKHRIDIPKFKYNDSLNLTGGLIIQMNQADPGKYDNFPTLSLTQQARLYEPEQADIGSTDSLAIMNWYYNATNNTGWGNNMQNQYLAYAIACANGGAPCFPCPNKAMNKNQHLLWKAIRSQTDYQSFATYFILAELARDPDGYHKSTFMYKTPDAQGKPGKVYAGPLWDKNKSFGNTVLNESAFTCGCQQTASAYFYDTTGWSYCMASLSQAPVWWETLLLDTMFCNTVKTTWTQYRSPGGILADSALVNFVNSQAAYLQTTGAQQRHYNRWPGYTYSFDHNKTQLNTYLQKRLVWMDNHIDSLLNKTSGKTY